MPARRRVLLVVATVGAAGGLLLSCTDSPSGFSQPVPGRFAIAPRFTSTLAGLVPIDLIRFQVVRASDGSIAKDTTFHLAAGADSVDLSVSVLLLKPEETFEVSLALVTPGGVTAFRAGPITLALRAGSRTVPVALADFIYTGIGAHAASVGILDVPEVPLLSGAAALLTATAFDALGDPIPGTPIAWRSLDESVAAVPDLREGAVLAGALRGTARIVAELLTGQADTVTVGVTLPPIALIAESGLGQSGPITSLLPNPLIARVTASDGLGVPDVPVTFTVTTGGGLLSDATVFTDVDGRAPVLWTLGPNIGLQTVTARTAALPGASAIFDATGLGSGVGSVAVFAGDAQAALVGTLLPVLPAVIVRDAQGNPVPGTAVTYAVSQGNGSVTGRSATTDAQGVAQVGGWTLGPAAGINTLTATVQGLNAVVFTALGTGPNGAVSMLISGGDGQSGIVGTALGIAPQVTVRDTAGKPAPGVPVTFAVTGGGGSVADPTQSTATDGTARAGSWTLGLLPGTNLLSANVMGLQPVTFTATGLVSFASR